MQKSLIKNTFFYAIIQASNFLLPMITLPYISRVVGVANFGKLEFAFGVVNILIFVTNYSFNFTATRDISSNMSDKKKVENFFSAYLSAKIFLLGFSTLILGALFFVEKMQSMYIVVLFTYVGIIGNVIFPTWLYQGMHKVKSVAIFNFLGKLIILPLIFIVIKNPDDYIYRPLIVSSVNILVSAFTLYYARKVFDVKFSFKGFREIFPYLKNSSVLFFSIILAVFYSRANISIVGMYGGVSDFQLGIYSSAERIMEVIINVIILSFSQVMYPHFTSLISKSIIEFIRQFKKAILILVVVTSACGIGMYFMAEFAVNLIFGDKFADSSWYLQVYSVLPFLIAGTNLFLYQGLSAFKKDNYVLIVNGFGAVLNLSCIIFVLDNYGIDGIIYWRVIVQASVFFASSILFFVLLKQKNIKFI